MPSYKALKIAVMETILETIFGQITVNGHFSEEAYFLNTNLKELLNSECTVWPTGYRGTLKSSERMLWYDWSFLMGRCTHFNKKS